MASRRKLKKTIQFVISELITDLFFRSLMSKDKDAEKIDKLVVELVAIDREFTLRVNRPDGKDNSKLVKVYYRKLFSDWQQAMETVIKKIESI